LAVKYFSNDRTLNATHWLSSPFEESSLQRVRNYEMLIDVDSAYDIGQDYQVVISADALTKAWTRIVRVSSPTPGENKIIDPGESKILNQTNNCTGFYEGGKHFVDLSLDLSAPYIITALSPSKTTSIFLKVVTAY
jgi:hypothetical protein